MSNEFDTFGYRVEPSSESGSYLMDQAVKNAGSEPNKQHVDVSREKEGIDEGDYGVDELPIERNGVPGNRIRVWQVLLNERSDSPFWLVKERGLYVVKKTEEKRTIIQRLFRRNK